MTKQLSVSVIGLLPRDHGGVGIQTAANFRTRDATATPKNSPLSYSSAVVDITVPDDAVQIILAPTTDLRVGEDPAMDHYDVIAAGSKEALPVALMQHIYLKRDAADGVVYFRFAEV